MTPGEEGKGEQRRRNSSRVINSFTPSRQSPFEIMSIFKSKLSNDQKFMRPLYEAGKRYGLVIKYEINKIQ